MVVLVGLLLLVGYAWLLIVNADILFSKRTISTREKVVIVWGIISAVIIFFAAYDLSIQNKKLADANQRLGDFVEFIKANNLID